MSDLRRVFARETELGSRALARMRGLWTRGRATKAGAIAARKARRLGSHPGGPIDGPRRVQRHRALRQVPLRRLAAWSLSCLFHLALLAAVVSHMDSRPERPQPRESFVQIRLAAPRTQRPEPPAPKPPVPPADSAPETPSEPTAVADAEAAHEESDAARTPNDSRTPTSTEARTGRPAWLGLGPPPPLVGGRRGEGSPSPRAQALSRYGGDQRTEAAVALGLEWLAAHQDRDGGWSPREFRRHCGHATPCKGPGSAEHRTGVTSLALLAFLGAGHVPGGDSPYARQVARALGFVLAQQDRSGRFDPGSQLPGSVAQIGGAELYDHAIASLTVAEAAARLEKAEGVRASVRRKLLTRLGRSARAALEYSTSCQQPGGGWDYLPGRSGRDDLSISGWQVLAWKAARTIDIEAPATFAAGAQRHLTQAFTLRGEGIYANRGTGADRRGPNMSAVALLSWLSLGGSRNDPRVGRAARRLLAAPPRVATLRQWDTSFQSYYYWYSASLALFHLGGHAWEIWNDALKRTLLPLQQQKGHAVGSFNPEPNWIGASGGRVYATAISVLTLEVYYRYVPFFARHREPTD